MELFHPLIGKWFTERLGTPTDIQAKAWPEIARGRHALIVAPTGSGKTLTAFLWAINQLITGAWTTGQTRVLYVSPLKALNNDVRRNLMAPLSELAGYFRQAGEAFPQVTVLTRSGDTPAEERRQMLKHPPEILITTPESLNIVLSSRSGLRLLNGIATVILDEIHAVIGTKRGTHLMTAVDRLVRLTGEFQRLALSATVRPVEVVAEFVGGYVHGGEPHVEPYKQRPVRIIRSSDKKRTGTCPDSPGGVEGSPRAALPGEGATGTHEAGAPIVEVRFPPDAREHLVNGSWWPVLVEAFKQVIRNHRSTLLFVNSRRTAEKVTRLINEGEPRELAYAHHGSLSREIRLAVEQRLKDGELKAIVATSSLELGIDIGELDLVILIETPPAISSAIQRIGRSGHTVRGVSRGLLYPTHGSDFLNAAVMARSVTDQDIEPIRPIEAPLDVLAQVIVSMVGHEEWDVEELFAFIRTSYPYRHLSRKAFDLVLSMLAGRYAETRLRELRPRVSLDRVDNTVHGKEGVERLIYLSGGTIPDRGYYDLRIEESHAKIGELDEEFVWERSIGDTFALGAHVWRIQRITPNDVEVVLTEAKPGIFPFWKAEEQNRDFHFSEKILLFLERGTDRLDEPSFRLELLRDYFLDEAAADELASYLRRQRETTGAALPHRHHLLIEHFEDPLNTSGMKQVLLHTVWGGRVNRPFSLALQAAWEEKYRYHLEIIENNDCLLLMLPHAFSAEEIFSLVTPENLERLLRVSLEKSGFFGAKFRENAGRALLLPKVHFNKRLPLWLNRLRSKKLMDAVLQYPDFPILLETWRTCLQDDFDLPTLRQLLDEVRAGQIRLTEVTTTTPSPFSEGLIWKQTNTYMYEDDASRSGKSSRLSGELLKEVLFSTSLRPRIPQNVVDELVAKLQRTAPGYAPRSARELLDWVKERLLIPRAEWERLLGAMERDHGIMEADAVEPVKEKLLSVRLPGASERMYCALENVERLRRAFSPVYERLDIRDVTNGQPLEPDALRRQPVTGEDNRMVYDERDLSGIFLQWLSFYGPTRKSSLKELLGLGQPAADNLIAGAVEGEQVILDLLTESAEEPEICDRENLETLLRMARRARQPSFKALPVDRLPLFLAAWQGLTAPGESMDDLQERLDQLFGYPAAADAWEKYILPARLSPYYGSWLDSLIHGTGLVWFGCGNRKLSFAFDDDLELFVRRAGDGGGETPESAGDGELSRLFPRSVGRYNVRDIARFSKSESRAVTKRLWDLAWKALVTNDTFTVVRQGILTDFAPAGPKEGQRRSLRMGHSRWGAAQPFPGNWYMTVTESIEKDPIDEAELIKDRARQLFRRYGILFRELVASELPLLQWSGVFKALRLMELSGEVLSGHFFEGVPGIQFISHEAFRVLNEPVREEPVYWMNAADPASLCGTRLDSLKGLLPSRIPSTYLVYRGQKPVVIARRNGTSLTFHFPSDDPRIFDYLSFFKVLLARDFNPEKGITVETINGKPARESDYAGPLKEFGFSAGYRGLELVKRYG